MKDNRRDFLRKGTAMAAMSVVGIGMASAGIPGSDTTSGQAKKKSQTKVKWPIFLRQ